jgi:hypothetical protein
VKGDNGRTDYRLNCQGHPAINITVPNVTAALVWRDGDRRITMLGLLRESLSTMSLIMFIKIKMWPLPFREGSNEKNARPIFLVYCTYYSKARPDVLNVVRFIVYLRVVTCSRLYSFIVTCSQ